MSVPAVLGELEWAGAGSTVFTDIADNGDFTTDTLWTKGTGVTISGGTLNFDGTQVTNTTATQTPATAPLFDRRHTVEFEITAYTAGQVRISIGNDTSAWLSGAGFKRVTLSPSAGTDITVEGDVDFNGSIDNLAVLQPQNPTHKRNYGELMNLSYRSATRARSPLGTFVPEAGAVGLVEPGSLAVGTEPIVLITVAPTGPSDPPAPLGSDVVIAPDFHGEYHFQLWVLPPVLQLANPQLNTAIGFRLWNTWGDTETISAVLVNGSAVLTFDIIPGTSIRDGQYRLANMYIGPGEPSIEADVIFQTENLQGALRVLAAVADTFNLIPDVPVREQWQFLTDILVAHDGTEQRVSLRPRPRIEQNFTVEIINREQRRQQWQLVSKNIRVQSLVPFYQYSTKLTAPSAIGATKVFFDPVRTNMRPGEFLVIVNPETEDIVISRVLTLDADGANLNAAISFDVTPQWIVAPAFNCLIGDGSGVTMNKVTGSLRVKANTFEEPALIRPGSTATVNTLAADGLPILERRPLIPASEDWEYRREVLDNETGKRDLNSRDLHGRVGGKRRFVIQRVGDPTELDYWRTFFDTVRGAWGAFRLPTYFPDLTLVPGQTPLAQGFSGFDVQQGDYAALYYPYETWKALAIEFANGYIHYCYVTNATANPDGTNTISFTPSVPSSPDLVEPTVISYLTKVRAEDNIQLEHYADVSYISFAVTSTDEG